MVKYSNDTLIVFIPKSLVDNAASNSILCRVQTMTVRVNNVSLAASEEDVKEFFSFSGEIHFVEMQRSAHHAILA